MELSDIIKELKEKEVNLSNEIGDLNIKIFQLEKELSAIRKMLRGHQGKDEDRRNYGYLKKIKTFDLIIIAISAIGGKGTKPQIMDSIQTIFKLSPTQSENACRNHLSTMVNEGILIKDDSGTLRVYVYLGPKIEYDSEKQELSKTLTRQS